MLLLHPTTNSLLLSTSLRFAFCVWYAIYSHRLNDGHPENQWSITPKMLLLIISNFLIIFLTSFNIWKNNFKIDFPTLFSTFRCNYSKTISMDMYYNWKFLWNVCLDLTIVYNRTWTKGLRRRSCYNFYLFPQVLRLFMKLILALLLFWFMIGLTANLYWLI